MQKKYDLKIKQKKITPEEAAAAAEKIHKYCNQYKCIECPFYNWGCILNPPEEDDLKEIIKAAKLQEVKAK